MIRQATTADAATIAAIYNHYVLNTSVTFEEQAVSTEQMAERIAQVKADGLPWLVLEQNGELLAYAYATKWRARSAYRFSVESTVYVKEGVTAKGLGSQLYQQLLAELNTVDEQRLSEQNQINLTILRYRLQNQIDEYTYGDRYMPLTAESGFHSDVIFQLARHQIKSVADVKNYLKKLGSLPRYIAQQTDWMRQGIAKGYTQPKAVFVGYEQGILSFIQQDIDKSVFFRPLLKSVPAVPEDQWQALQQQAYGDGSGMRGLGLVLADLVARAHGGQTVLPECVSGFTIELHWPAP